MITIQVYIDLFFTQVQRKRNPQWNVYDLIVVYQSRVLCATDGAERRGVRRGSVLPPDTISPENEMHVAGRLPIKCIVHDEITRDQFQSYWTASRNIFTVLQSLGATVKRNKLNEYYITFSAESLSGATTGKGYTSLTSRLDELTDRILDLITDIGFFASIQLHDDASPVSSIENIEDYAHRMLTHFLGESTWHVICHLTFPMMSAVVVDDPTACYHEYTMTLQDSVSYADALDDDFVATYISSFAELFWGHCRLELSSSGDDVGLFQLLDIYVQLHGIPIKACDAGLRAAAHGPFLFSFTNNLMVVEVDQAVELLQMVVKETKSHYSMNQLNSSAVSILFHMKLKLNIAGDKISPSSIIQQKSCTRDPSTSPLPRKRPCIGINDEISSIGDDRSIELHAASTTSNVLLSPLNGFLPLSNSITKFESEALLLKDVIIEKSSTRSLEASTYSAPQDELSVDRHSLVGRKNPDNGQISSDVNNIPFSKYLLNMVYDGDCH